MWFFSGCWRWICLMASHLSFMSIFVEPPNVELCFVDREFFDICSESSHCIFLYFIWRHTFNYIFFFRETRGGLSVFFSDRRWKHWRMCNVKLLIICGECSDELFWNGVGHLPIITPKFCGVRHNEFSWYCTLRITDKYVHICRPLTLIAVFIISGGREMVNYHDILLCFSQWVPQG